MPLICLSSGTSCGSKESTGNIRFCCKKYKTSSVYTKELSVKCAGLFTSRCLAQCLTVNTSSLNRGSILICRSYCMEEM
jgi:hypothetical protein